MSKLAKALNAETVLTENGAKAYASTLSSVLDFFFKAPASRGQDLRREFSAALAEDTDLAVRALQWLRDAREGAGERGSFRTLLTYLTEKNPEIASKLVTKVPELGRFDDLEAFWGTSLEREAALVWLKAMSDDNALAFKWAPRKDKKGAKPLRSIMGMNEQQWRTLVVANSDTVEQKMCAKKFDSINFEHVPSVAMARYAKSFAKNCTTFEAYKEKLVSGEAKINAGAIFPHDIVKSCKKGDATTASAQWDALPNFLEGSLYKNILPVVDCSYSMTCAVSGETTAMDVAVSLGMYCSERSEGHFKDMFMTFSNNPKLQVLKGTLAQRIQQLETADWSYSTDLQRVFTVILRAAVEHSVPANEMPDVILIPSDMQFNCCGNSDQLYAIRAKFQQAGYEAPKVVFWQMNARAGGIPMTMDASGAALVAGFSPSILKSVLSGEIDPMQVMLRTLNVERYKV